MNLQVTCFRSERIWRYTSFCVLIIAATLARPAGAQVTGLDGAVSIWRLDQGSGTEVAENDIDQTFNGLIVGSRAWQAGMYGEALVFNGEDNAVEVASNPLIGAHALTVQAYIRPTGIPDEESSKIFNIALEREAEGVDRFMLDILPDYNVNNWVLSHFMSIAGVVTDPEDDLLDSGTFHSWDQWYHVAMVFDSVATDSVRISHYVNHALEYTTLYQLDTLREGAVFIGERYQPKGELQIRNYFEGLMDNVVLHARALTPPEFMPATDGPIAVDDEYYGAPPAFHLAQNYPNPFNPLTFIEYSLHTPQYIRLSIYSIDGRLVKLLDEGYKPAGTYLKVWHGRDEHGQRLSSGIYLYHLESALGYQRIKKAIFMK